MKRKIVGIFICTLVIATALPAVGTMNDQREQNAAMFFPPGVDWMKTYGGEEFNWLFDIEITDDGYIAGGLYELQNRMCAWMLKTDKNGAEEWSAYNDLWFGTSPIAQDVAVQCVLPVDDGFIAGGYGLYNETSADTVVGYLWKVNLTGETQWLKQLGNETELWSVSPFGIIQVGNELICGGWKWYSTTPPNIELDAAWFKTDLDGNLNVSSVQNYDAGGWDWVRSIALCDDEGYFLTGSTEEPNPSVDNGAYYMVKTDRNGNMEWDNTFDGPGEDYGGASGCQQTSEGGYIMAGHSVQGTDRDAWIVKTDASGIMEWNKTYGGEKDDHCYGMAAVDAGYVFVIVKNAWFTSGNREELLIVWTDEEGNVLWEFEVYETGTQWLQTIHQIADGGFIVAGRNGVLTSSDCSGIIMEIAPFPRITIDVSGGFGVKTTFTNNGVGDADNTAWRITVTGGFLGLVNKTTVGTIDVLAGESQEISSDLFFGLGPISITVKFAVLEKNASAFLLGPFILGVKYF